AALEAAGDLQQAAKDLAGEREAERQRAAARGGGGPPSPPPLGPLDDASRQDASDHFGSNTFRLLEVRRCLERCLALARLLQRGAATSEVLPGGAAPAPPALEPGGRASVV
ncbi:unnamed protein product, partial [Prorocentrum cordatum]